MILKMEKVSLIGLAGDKNYIMGKLMRAGCVDIKRTSTVENYDEISELTNSGEVNTYSLEQELSSFASAIKAVSEYEQKASIFTKKSSLSYEEILDETKLENAAQLRDNVLGTVSRINNLKSEKNKADFLHSSLEPWENYDAGLDVAKTKDSVVTLCTIAQAVDKQNFVDALNEKLPLAVVETVGSISGVDYFAILCHKASLAELNSLLSEYEVVKMDFSELRGTAKENIARLAKESEHYDSLITEQENKLKDYSNNSGLLKQAYDAIGIKIEKEKAMGNVFHTQSTFALSAWIPEENVEDLKHCLEGDFCYLSFEKPQKGENTPVKLKNSKIIEPFEVITEMYSLPAPTGIDPNPFMAPFFFIFFGMMLSDAGYGILLMLLGFVAPKFMSLTDFSKKLFKLLGYCGLSTVIWGAIYGGWFGDIVPAIARTFFNKEITIPTLINPLEQPILILGMSFALGVIHLFVGMGLKAYMLIRSGHALDALYDIGFWYLTLIGLPLLLLGGTAAQVGKYMAIVGAIGLVLTQGRHKKGIFGKITSGVLSLYDVTGYFSDVLSYSRILALGLATGVIATVVNTMGTLPGANLIGAIVLLLVFVFGHTLNLGINALGSYVHASRLQYVEFFGKFYEGGGKAFTPFKANPKYIFVKHEEEK